MYTMPIYYSRQHYHSPVLVTPTHTYYPSFIPPANIHPDTYENAARPIYTGAQYRPSLPISISNSYDPDWVVTPITILSDEQYKCIGYCCTGYDDGCIVKIGVPHDADHDMDRNNIENREYSTYKTNKAHVLSIMDIKTGPLLVNTKYNGNLYKVNHQIVTDDRKNISFVLSEKIVKDRNMLISYQKLVSCYGFINMWSPDNKSIIAYYPNGSKKIEITGNKGRSTQIEMYDEVGKITSMTI
jgi:hypothetical protein